MGCHFKCSKKRYDQEELRSIIWFYLEMVSHRAISDIMETPKKEMDFSALSLLYCF